MNSRTDDFKIEGMSCGHCVEAVKRALNKLDGVESHQVTIGAAKVGYNADVISREKISEAIEETGYHVVTVA